MKRRGGKISRILASATLMLCCGLAASGQTAPTQARSAETDSLISVSAAVADGVPAIADGDGVFLDLTPEDASETPKDNLNRYDVWVERKTEFNPSPTRAVWMSALFPGLGQVYNRCYWKLPIIIGGYLGLAYATSWNNGMLTDYTRAYRDIMDNDPSTKSYMDFFPPTTQESDLDKTWLTNVLQSRKNYFRRNRDLCIIAMVGVYLLAMVDAYVDASLSHFDISPDLSMDISPAIFQEVRGMKPSVGINWAITF